MRLINTSTMQLEEFMSLESTPQYAILSHTWGIPKDEATFQDIGVHIWSNAEEEKYGYEKIRMSCQLARVSGLQYAWIDTCCIDKTSSAELSESINSMFKWYHQAAVCFAYLEDWEPEQDSFAHCKWFTRGWTLQELIAPKTVTFYDKTWKARGDKSMLRSEIYQACGVPEYILTGETQLSGILISARMEWAANRTTSREEDVAYCLLGIFDVNMPLLYGEGKKAFLRLQEHLIQEECQDLSIFAWQQSEDQYSDYMGILAPSPKEFKYPSRAQGGSGIGHCSDFVDFSVSNRGIKFEVQITIPLGDYSFIPLYFFSDMPGAASVVGIWLQIVGKDFIRAFPDRFGIVSWENLQSIPQTYRIAKSISLGDSDAIRTRFLHLRTPSDLEAPNFGLVSVSPSSCWQPVSHIIQTFDNTVVDVILNFNPSWATDYTSFTLVCRYFNPRVEKRFTEGIWQCELFQGREVLGVGSCLDYWHQRGLNSNDYMPSCYEDVLELENSRGYGKNKRIIATIQMERIEGRPGFPFLELEVQDVQGVRNATKNKYYAESNLYLYS